MYSPLENITLPKNLKKIPLNCFYSTSSLLDIELPSNLEEIGAGAFEESGIESIFIPAKTQSIGAGAFTRCRSLSAIYVDSNNSNFRVYNGCLYSKNLKTLICAPITLNEIIFPVETEEVYYMSSSGNNNLLNLILSDNITVIRSGAFADCKNLKDITFSRSLQIIEGAAFSDCKSLIKLDLPKSLLEIEDYAFFWCSNIKSISFGSNLKVIGEAAFDMVKADKIIIKAVMPPSIEEDTFTDYNATLVVPKGRVQAYSKATGWKNFKTITDDQDAGVEGVIVDDEKSIIKVYDMNGIFISNTTENLEPGIYIVCEGNSLKKFMVK